MDHVLLETIEEEACFILPGRPAGVHAGKVITQGMGSTTVHIPRHEGDGWDTLPIARGTQVYPCHRDVYENQGFGQSRDSRVKNRSEVKKPCDIVWAVCKEMSTSPRNDIIAECIKQGVNPNTAKTQYYKWRKQNG